MNKCTLNVQDFAIVSGDAPGAGAMSRKKSFRKSLRESFRRLRRGRSQRNQQVGGDNQQASKPPAFGRVITGVRTLNAPSTGGGAATTGAVGVGSGNEVGIGSENEVGVHHRNVFSNERQVEQKVELSSIVKCITLTSAVITNNPSFKPTLWVGTNSGQVLVYVITLASEQQDEEQQQHQEQPQQDQQAAAAAAAVSETSLTTAKLAKEIQLKHKAPIIAIFTSPEAPSQLLSNVADCSVKSSPEKQLGDKDQALQARVLICSEEQFKVFNLPNLKPFCKFKLTAHEGLRAKKISITQFLKPLSNSKQQVANSANSTNLASGVGGSSSLSASKSLQSFATQTSPPASPTPPADGAAPGSEVEANNTTNLNGSKKSGANNNKQQAAESNNNSLSTLDHNNHANNSNKQDNSKELMNAKFGAKTSCNANNSQSEKDFGSEQLVGADQSSLFEPYMVCMSNQGDCAIYSVPDLKRQAQIQVCKREDINGINSTMLTNYGEGFYLKSSSNFLRFSISTQRVLRALSVV